MEQQLTDAIEKVKDVLAVDSQSLAYNLRTYNYAFGLEEGTLDGEGAYLHEQLGNISAELSNGGSIVSQIA